ncbi:hypothetical protein GTZ97_12790 [Aquabacterium fontiphilum]|uniref:chalcone isomerase family protein n=1 Tax=Aquabacterium fontiphilum TaxID=450365 RepID=UPI00137739A8|nr:chalcone isomerase family protein [Aquabacterium fontiphilum]NBD21541.1 hypothetical protein [Aquabacterium fontiphilum]
MKAILRTTLAGAILSLALGAHAAVDVSGIKFNDTVSVAGQTLQLNGAGKRVRIIVDVYAMGLYVPKVENDAAALMRGPGPKSVQIVLMRDLSGEDFAEAMIKGFNQNHSDADRARFQPRLDELSAAMRGFGKITKGTVVNMNQVPGAGLRVLVNGEQRAKDIPGDDFYAAILKIWLGDKPADSDLKNALLKNR